MARPRPLVLTILDGWGYSPAVEANAIAAARKPVYDELLRVYPNTLIHTSGPFVGLPEGQMGNSEVGHLNIGAGRVLHMDVTRIDEMIASGEFFRHPALLAGMKHAATRRLHLMGLASQGGVHSRLTHLYALLKMAREQGVTDVSIHCFLDGRDTPPESGLEYIREIEKQAAEIGVGRIASVAGRYWAMDRDKRWERIERARGAMVLGDGHKFASAAEAVRRSYERGITDEFVEPATIDPDGLIREDDAVIFYNFRADRAREMTSKLAGVHLTTMTQYDKTFAHPFVLPREHPNNILANVFAQLGWKNLRLAETEKYAHVTYFFNGGTETAFAGEEREMVPSPKVATYDLKPEMSAEGITAVAEKAIGSGDFDVVVMNFANADMVGHSGKMEPAVRAVEAVDACLGRIYRALREKGGAWVISADHGNAEVMVDPVTGSPHTYHTTNPVPLVLVNDAGGTLREDGALQDIAPTVLGVLGVDPPREMKGKDLRIGCGNTTRS
ncbi:MAG: 2,3-bisphosphoglycerate-independent phosphoglycerate mutase [Bryobacteraceae bacterium]